MREVLSYSRRGSRFTPTQAQAWDQHHERWVIPDTAVDEPDFDLTRWFGRQAPLIVEIGSGVGEATAVLAAARPDHDVLALEVWRPGVADTLWRLAEALCARLGDWPGTLWIDDRVDLALALPFAGVHLGQHDLPPREARRLLPARVVIGRSTHDREQLLETDPATYYLKDHYRNYPSILVRLGEIHPDALRDLLRMAWTFVSAKARARRSRSRPAAAGAPARQRRRPPRFRE